MRWKWCWCPVESMWLGLAAMMDDWVLCRFKYSAFSGTRHNEVTLEIFSFSRFFCLSLEAPLCSKRLLYCYSLDVSWYYLKVCEWTVVITLKMTDRTERTSCMPEIFILVLFSLISFVFVSGFFVLKTFLSVFSS